MANRKARRNRLVILKVLCALIVGGCLILPLGGLVFPYLDIANLPFSAIEAVVSATVGFGIADLLG
jgi:pilus assembly protein TadC